MNRDLVRRNELVDWQVAPAEHEINNYDEPMIRYRRYVEDFAKQAKTKIRKKTFYTISTNVLCADITTSKESIDPIDRDLYLPLEIAIVKWSVRDTTVGPAKRKLESKTWMINPGPPTRNCNHHAEVIKKQHKILFDPTDYTQNNYIEPNLEKLAKEINSFLSADRTVFSLGIKYVRQDLGCLKWLNREIGYKLKPVKVYSLEDLYVVLMRNLNPDMGSCIGQGLARHRMTYSSEPYKYQCVYHQAKAQDYDGESAYCASGLAIGYTHQLLEDLAMAEVEEEPTKEKAEDSCVDKVPIAAKE